MIHGHLKSRALGVRPFGASGCYLSGVWGFLLRVGRAEPD